MPNFVFADNEEFYKRWKEIADNLSAPAFAGTLPNPVMEDNLFIWQQMVRVALAVTSLDTINSQAGIVAAGATQATATPLTTDFNRVDTVGAGEGVRLDAATVNKKRVVINNGGNDLNVYPASGEEFFNLGANNPIILTPGTSMEVFCFTAESGIWTLIS